MQCEIMSMAWKKGMIVPLLVLLLTLGACMKTVHHPPLEVTFLPNRGDFISGYGDPLSPAEVMGMMRGKDYILIGEGHRNVCDHKMQQQVLGELTSSNVPLAVGLEMVAVDMQPILDDFAQGQIEMDDLEEELQWKTKWGYSYSLFRGLFEIARRNSLPVAGLNVPTRVTRKITREGLESLTDEERAFLPKEIVPPSNAQVPFLDMIFSQHFEKDTKGTIKRDRFHLVQSIWDSKMAEEAVRLHGEYNWPVMVIAGGGHVENGWGIARRIRRLEPGAKIFILMPWRGGDFDDEAADALFYCPDTYESKMGATLVATGTEGLLVEVVKRDSRAAKAGLRPGDVLVEAAGIRLESLFSLHMAGAKTYELGKELVFTVRRGSEIFEVNVGKLGQGKKTMSGNKKHGMAGGMKKMMPKQNVDDAAGKEKN